MIIGRSRDLWVFAYGSLMWRPGFPHVEAVRARLTGYRRALCVYSVHWRGTPRRPGLVLGLDRSGECEGIAYRVDQGDRDQVIRYLRGRELVYGVYREALLPVHLATGAGPPAGGRTGEAVAAGATIPAEVMAIAYVAERSHPSYAGVLPLGEMADIVRRASGRGGTNLEYVSSTLERLAGLAIRERGLERLATVLGAFAVGRAAPASSEGRSSSITRAAAARSGRRCPRRLRDRNCFAYRQRMPGLH